MGNYGKLYGKWSLDEYEGKQFKLMQNEKKVYWGIIEWRLKEDLRYNLSGIFEWRRLLDVSNYGRGENYYCYIEEILIN